MNFRVQKKKQKLEGDGEGGGGEEAEKAKNLNQGFDFDMVERHRMFFEYIRDKKWDSVASFLEKKSVMFSGKGCTCVF